jgi:hypothetical protein
MNVDFPNAIQGQMLIFSVLAGAPMQKSYPGRDGVEVMPLIDVVKLLTAWAA